MSSAIKGGSNTAGLANVTTDFKLEVAIEPVVAGNEGKIGAAKLYSENDNGSATGTPQLSSPETDSDFRLRTATEVMLDNEVFNYTAQNTGKHNYTNTTMTMFWGINGVSTNAGAVTTTNIGCTFGTYAEFPILNANSLNAEFIASFNLQPVSNSVIDFGLFRRGATTQFAPTDGVYFRLGASGLSGVLNYNTVETTCVFTTPFTYVANKKYKFVIVLNSRSVQFWIDDKLYGTLIPANSQPMPVMSSSLPLSLRHAHSGAASGAINFMLSNYSVSVGGSVIAKGLAESNNAIMGSYQGLSGGAMGALAAGTVTSGTLVVPTAAVPLNTSLAANLPNGLGGRALETLTSGLALATDGILSSYLVPAGTVAIQGKRLKIRGVKLTAFIQSVMVGGAMINEFKLAFGHTAVSLATAEAATTKKPRFVLLPELMQVVAVAQAAQTLVSQPFSVAYFEEPIYVNPGEYIQLVITHQGVACTAGVIQYNIQYDYSWE